MYSDSGSSLQHYGVLGMKWGVRKARQENDAHRKYMNSVLYKQNRSAYKSGNINKDTYKSNREKIKMISRRARAKNKKWAQSMIDSYYNEPGKFKKAYTNKRDIVGRNRNRLDKITPGWGKHQTLYDGLIRNETFGGRTGAALGLSAAVPVAAAGVSAPLGLLPAVGAGVGAGVYAAKHHKDFKDARNKLKDSSSKYAQSISDRERINYGKKRRNS